MNGFNDFPDFDRKFKRTFSAIVILNIIFFLFGLALLGGIIYVAWHFISKFW